MNSSCKQGEGGSVKVRSKRGGGDVLGEDRGEEKRRELVDGSEENNSNSVVELANQFYDNQ
jgi:hypothetical protein